LLRLEEGEGWDESAADQGTEPGEEEAAAALRARIDAFFDAHRDRRGLDAGADDAATQQMLKELGYLK
jgi:hypothetical protein